MMTGSDKSGLLRGHVNLQGFLAGLLSTPMGVEYVVISFDMEEQPLVTHNAV